MGLLEFLLSQLASTKAYLSVGYLYFLYLSYKLSLFWMTRLISWVIHGNEGFVLIVRCGTCCSISDCSAPLNSSQSKLMDLPSWETRKDFWNRSIWFSSPSQSAFLYINISVVSACLPAVLWKPQTAQHHGLLYLVWFPQISPRLGCLLKTSLGCFQTLLEGSALCKAKLI